MSFDKVLKRINRPPVIAGIPRMQPQMRELATRLMTRFAETREEPLPIAEEGAAFALWGPDDPEPFLVWHREQGGLARALEVLLAAIAFERVTYEWDGSIWALRRARPVKGIDNLGTKPWLWLRTQLAKAKPAERAVAREVAAHASRAWIVRAMLAFIFPDDQELWKPADDAELRQADVREYETWGVLVAMRGATLDHKKIEKEWQIKEAITPKAMIAELGDQAVSPLRLIGAFEELAHHRNPDALRALAEFSDIAWDVIAKVPASKDTIAALAPMFTTQRPRRVLGAHLARGLFNELVVAAPAAAKQLAGKTGDSAFIASVLAETGVLLPADEEWTSPWAVKSVAVKTKPAPAPVKKGALDHPEKIHWKPSDRDLKNEGLDRRSAKTDREKERELPKEAKRDKVFILDLQWMNDAPALRTWKAIPPKHWYGQVDDVEHLLARFELDELDSIIAFVQFKPDTLAALSRVESARVAPLMARGFALIKKQQEIGRKWLYQFPEAAAVGLLRDVDADKKQRTANEKALAYLSKKHKAIVDKVLARAGGGTSAADLAKADAPTLPGKPPKLPDFIDVARLPRPTTKDGHALSGASLVELAQLLKATLITPLPEGNPLIDSITERYTDESLSRFAWSLFRQWLFVKGPPKDKWALYAVGKFPDDENARALGRLARVWAPQGNPSRAQEAVETLGLMRTQTALLEIYDIARKVQSKALKARAEKVFESVAESMGLAPEELADRLVPELSEQDLTFGELRVELDASLSPRLVGSDGTSLTALPDGADPEEAKRWKELKRVCAAVARGQTKRLERSMAEGHRMPFSHFAEIYLMHSLIRNVSSSLLWGAYRDGKLAFVFAVEDGAAVDQRGKPLELPLDATYGVVHPAELGAKDRAAWEKRYDKQPFEQLSRQVFAATDARDCEAKLASLRGRLVPTTGLLDLQRRGWKRGESPQGGCYFSIEREGKGWYAGVVFTPGIYLGSPTEEPTQTIEGIVVRADTPPPASILSDIQRDLVLLAPQ